MTPRVRAPHASEIYGGVGAARTRYASEAEAESPMTRAARPAERAHARGGTLTAGRPRPAAAEATRAERVDLAHAAGAMTKP